LNAASFIEQSFGLFTLLLGWDEEDVDVGENTAGGNSGVAKESVEFLIVADGQLNVSWDDSGLLVVFGGVSSEFENLSGEVFEDCSEIDWGTSTDAFGVSAVLEETGNTTNWELKTSLG
jgi:hypothetical protein